jgi:hypothetical protein
MGTAGLSILILVVICSVALAGPKPELCMDDTLREEIRAVMLEGVKDALRRHTMKVFNVWMKEPTASDQPARAKTGIRLGVEAYVGSRRAAHAWDPPLCPGG